VPSLAFTFSLLKGLGLYERLRTEIIQPALDANLGVSANLPASAQALREAIEKILDLVSQTNVSQLGLAGFIVIVLAIIRMLDNVELAFNTIWGIARSRSLVRKVADYLTIALVTPLLVTLAVTLTSGTQNSAFVGWLRNWTFFAGAIDRFFGLTPWIALWIGFSLLYITLPNVQPRLVSALLGGVIGGTLFQLTQIAHIQFQMGVAQYNAIYSSFAAFPIFLVWIYLSWLTVMVGAEFAHAHEATGQHREMVLGEHAGDAREDVLALQIMMRIARAFRDGSAPWSRTALALDLNVPSLQLDRIVNAMLEAGILVAGEREEGGIYYLPGRELQRIRISDVVIALRQRGPTSQVELSDAERDARGAAGDDPDAALGRALEQFYAEATSAKSNKSMGELLG
jgi:membrane protein